MNFKTCPTSSERTILAGAVVLPNAPLILSNISRRAYAAWMGTGRPASAALEAFIDEGIKLAMKRGYNPTIFIGMRHQHGTVDAIERLVQSGDIQSGFRRLNQLSLLDWTIESAVTKFPAEFSHNARQCAEWRLQQVQHDSKNTE